ncbi:MAG: mevalonate kinase [Archangium sp.]|nr:mevalonate kinase [Archangium sp.]
MRTTAFGPGKVIVLGEHGVVYGHPALAGPISRGVRAWAEPSERTQLELPDALTDSQRDALERAFARAAKKVKHPKVSIHVESDLPPSMGLGSSGALAVAIARVLLPPVTKAREVENLALEMEREFHGTPSGVDHTTSARGELILFQRGRAKVVTCPRPLKVLVAIAGKRGPTKVTVGALRERQARWPARYKRLFVEIASVVKDGAAAIRAGELESLGDAMNVNQGLLSALGLSSPPIEELVYRLRAMGAYGAKLTGAGGDGGAVIALFPEPEHAVVKLRAAGVDCFTSQLAGPRTL